MPRVATETRFGSHEVLHNKYSGSYCWRRPRPMLSCRLLTASAMLLLSLPARAARPRDAVLLDYVQSPAAAARCPTSDFLREEVHIRIGHDLFTPDALERLSVKVDRVDGAYRVTGELRSTAGDVTLADTFTSVECSTAIRSMAIMVAVRFTRLPEPCPVRQPPTADLVSPALAKPAPALVQPMPIPRRTPPPPERPSIRTGIASVFSTGTAPVVLGGVGWFIGVRWPKFSAALEGQALFAPSAELRSPRVHDSYHFLFVSASASGCAHGVWAFICTYVGWGSLSFGHATVNIDPDRTSRLGLGFRFGGERALTHSIALRAYFDAVLDPNPGVLKYAATTNLAIWHAPALSASAGFGPAMTF